MSLIQIKQMVRNLSLGRLRKLDDWLHELIRRAEESTSAVKAPPGKQIIEERTVENRTYRLEGVRCGKEKCKCAGGRMHGPYWYSYVRVGGRVKSQYVGKKLPLEVERGMNNRS